VFSSLTNSLSGDYVKAYTPENFTIELTGFIYPKRLAQIVFLIILIAFNMVNKLNKNLGFWISRSPN